MNGYGKLPPELWTRIFRYYVPQLQDWRTHPAARHIFHFMMDAQPLGEPVLLKDARVLAAVCSAWKHLVSTDGHLKFVLGGISQIRDYVIKDSPSSLQTATRVWASSIYDDASICEPLSEICEPLEALLYSTMYNHSFAAVFRVLAKFCFERLYLLRVHHRFGGINLSYQPLNLPSLTVLALSDIRIPRVESPSGGSITQFAAFLNALPHLERLELENFASPLVSIQQYTCQDIPPMEPARLGSLKTIYLSEKSYVLIFLLYHVTTPNLEYLEIYLSDNGEDCPTCDSWYRPRSDFSRLLKFKLSTLDCNTARLLTSCSFPQLSQLLVTGVSYYPSDITHYMLHPWPSSSLKIHVPKLQRLALCHSVPGQAWLLKQLCPEDGIGSNSISSLLLSVPEFGQRFRARYEMSEEMHMVDSALPSAFSNVRSLVIRVRSDGAAKKLDRHLFDDICRLFSNVEDLQVYLDFTIARFLIGFQYPTPNWKRKPREVERPVVLPRLERLSFFSKLDEKHGISNITMSDCVHLRAFLLARDSSGIRIKRLSFNRSLTPKTLSVIEGLVDEICMESEPWARLERMTKGSADSE